MKEEGSICILTLNRPARHNSLIPGLLQDLLSHLDTITRASHIRAVVLNAVGQSFSTGGDMRGFYEHRQNLSTYSKNLVGLLNQTIIKLIRLPIPVVVAVHGIVTGGSMGLVLGGDFVLLTPSVSFTPYYGVVGFSPDGGWTALLPFLIGKKRTADILINNRTISAQEALDWGMVNRIVPEERIQDEARQTATGISKMANGSIRSSKLLLNRYPADYEAGLQNELDQFVNQIQTPEAMQGITSFLNIR